MEYNEACRNRDPFAKPSFRKYSVGTTKILDESIQEFGENSIVGKELVRTKNYTEAILNKV